MKRNEFIASSLLIPLRHMHDRTATGNGINEGSLGEGGGEGDFGEMFSVLARCRGQLCRWARMTSEACHSTLL
jgi:hypothetical protein